MKADRYVLMGHSLGAVGCQLYLANTKRKFDALVLTGSSILRHYRNSSDLEKPGMTWSWDSGILVMTNHSS